jgi:hypothetical protein
LTKFFKQGFVKVLKAMTKAKFAPFQMQRKIVLKHASKLMQTIFDKASERLDAADVGHTLHKLVVAVEHLIV